MFNFREFNNVTKIYIGDRIQLTNGDFSSMFYNMLNLQQVDFNHINVNNMYNVCNADHNLLGNIAICGSNVTSMVNSYQNCYNLIGSPICGPNVINIIIGNNVTQSNNNFYNKFYNMQSLINCSINQVNVTNMRNTY